MAATPRNLVATFLIKEPTVIMVIMLNAVVLLDQKAPFASSVVYSLRSSVAWLVSRHPLCKAASRCVAFGGRNAGSVLQSSLPALRPLRQRLFAKGCPSTMARRSFEAARQWMIH